MRLYVVTIGEYDDYRIDKIFLDEEKAKKYVKYKNRYIEYDDKEATLEIYDTEDRDFNPVVDIWIRYSDAQKNWNDYLCTVESKTSLDKSINAFKIECYLRSYDKKLVLYMEQTLQIVIDDVEEFKDKYEKICRDLMTQIKNLYEIEGWTLEMINDWLREEYKDYSFS